MPKREPIRIEAEMKICNGSPVGWNWSASAHTLDKEGEIVGYVEVHSYHTQKTQMAAFEDARAWIKSLKGREVVVDD